MAVFSRGNLVGIARALGKPKDGLSVSEVGHLIEGFGIASNFDHRNSIQSDRLFKFFTMHLIKEEDQSAVLKFIEDAVDPSRYVDAEERHKTMCQNLNQVLLLAGFAVNDAGRIIETKRAQSLREAKDNAPAFFASLSLYDMHPYMLTFCRRELEENNYFHAGLEAVKSIRNRLRDCAKSKKDGATLVDFTLGIKSGCPPVIAINAFNTESDKSEQQGFLCLVKGMFLMFRNLAAHEPRIQSKIETDDLKVVFALASMVHRRLDNVTITLHHKTE